MSCSSGVWYCVGCVRPAVGKSVKSSNWTSCHGVGAAATAAGRRRPSSTTLPRLTVRPLVDCQLNSRRAISAGPYTHTHTRLTAPFPGTTRVSRYQKGKTNLDFTEARDNEWQWHQLGRMQVCTSFQTDNHASTPPLSFLQAGCSFCRPPYQQRQALPSVYT